jgi:uncharacterized protein (TIGR04255 family)
LPEFPKLARPPLREALVDVRLRDELPVAVIPKFRQPKGFPVVTTMKQGQFQFKVDANKPAEAHVFSEALLGQRYDREDGSAVVQLRRNGITYSALKNYPGWEVLRDSAREIWQDFITVSGNIIISRLAVRYVNAIIIPTGADLDEYLTNGPRVPALLPQVVTSFMHRMLIPIEELKMNAIVTQTLEMPSPVILDIDAFTERSFEASSDEIWTTLDELRGIADRTFFSSLTEKVIESYR